MTRPITSAAPLLAAAALSGCNLFFPTEDALENAYYDLRNEHIGKAATPETSVPDAGSAVYEGYIEAERNGSDYSYGTFTAETFFASDTVSGSATGFVDEDGTDYSGTLAIGGSLSRGTTVGVNLTLTGDLAAGGDTHSVAASGTGDLRGTNYEALYAEGTGTINDGTGPDPLRFWMIGER